MLLTANAPSIIFKENKGQWPNKVLFGTEFLNTKFYVNKTSFNYCVYNYEDLVKAHANHNNKEKTNIIHGHNYEVNFVGANLSNVTKKEEQPEYYNYFLGNDKSKWTSNVKAYKDLLFAEIYQNIDLNLYSNCVNLKYDFILKPGANSNNIKLNYKDVDAIETKNNELIIRTSVGEIIEKSPLAYQIINGRRKEIKCNYVLLNENTIGFSFPDGYNGNFELIIDPVVVVCSYSGSSVFSYNNTCTYDNNGNIYLGGTSDLGYPITLGAFQTSTEVNGDYVISAFNSVGSIKLFATYLGGNGGDYPMDIIVKNNEIVLYGVTSSTNFPHTISSFDTILNGSQDLTVSKLNLTGTSLLASTLIGGSGIEGLAQFASWQDKGEMVCDTAGNVFVISTTNSNDFPVTPGTISNLMQGSTDAFVIKLDKGLSNLIWSTYLGGSNKEDGTSIKLDGSGGVYCCGTTSSLNFPTTLGCYSPTKTGVSGATQDFFISHINSTGTAFIASSYLGTTGNEAAYLMDLDHNNNVYVCGHVATSALLIPTSGTYSNPNGVNVICKLDSSLSNLVFKTKFGNPSFNPHLFYTAFKVDSCQNIYLAGFAYNNMPTTPNQLMPFGGGYTDMYMAVFGADCSSLKFASYYGGPAGPPTGYSIIGEQSDGISHFNNKGILYLAVCAGIGLPTTPGAYSQNYANTTTLTSIYNDAFLKVDMQTFVSGGSSYGANITGCPPFTANFVSTTNIGTSIWNFGDGSPLDTNKVISHNYPNLGNYNVLLVVTDTNTCNRTDSIKTKLSVIPPTDFDLGPDKLICINGTALIESNITAVTYSWSTGANTQSITVSQAGQYSLTINNGGCNTSNIVNVVIGEKDLALIFPNVVTPNNDGVNDVIDFSQYNFGEMEFILFDRWGRERYKAKDASLKWDAREYDDGTYFYIISYKSNCPGENKKNKGFVSVFK